MSTESGTVKTPFETVSCGGIEVSHAGNLDGGGPRTWPYFVDAVRDHIGPVAHAYEWCSGPGYIGFSLLGSGLCERLTLADVNPEAVAACRETIARHGLEDRVQVYLSDNLRDIPDHEVWDLVIGDPPHFPEPLQRHIDEGFVLRSVDPGWKLHHDFFATIGAHVRDGSKLLLSESRVAGDNDAFFIEMLDRAGFDLVEPVWELGFNKRYCLHGRFRG